MIMLNALAPPVVVSSRHTSGGLAYKQGQRKKDNPEPRLPSVGQGRTLNL
jgi:hypothetical protein